MACSNKAHGCDWSGSVLDLKQHLNSDSSKPCPHLLISCPLQCGDLYELKDIDKHVSQECTHREVPCEHCGVTCALHLVEQHYTECEFFPTQCPKNCGEMVKRRYLEHHVNKECMYCTATCIFHDVGCEAVVKREDYETHVLECKERHIVKAHEKVIMEMQSLKNEIFKIKEENQFLHSKIASLHCGLKVCHENSDILRQENAQLKAVLSNELSYLHAMASPCEALAVNCIKTHLQGQVVHLVPGGASATFRITDYLHYKRTDEVWQSPPFYISQGYKFCLAVHLNGVGAGKGTHVAVYLHQVAGQFDSDLTWPVLLEEDLEIRLMKQEPPKEYKKSFFKGSMWTAPRSPPPPRGRPAADEGRDHSRSVLSLDASPTLSFRNASMPRNSTSDEGYKNVSEFQILSISQVLNRPEGTLSSVSKLELFCLLRTFEAAVFLDSVVIQCKLVVNQGSSVHAIRKADIGWKEWNDI